MRLSNNYVYHMSHGEAALIPTGDTEFSGLVRGNKTLGAILELLQSDTTEEEMIRKLTERFLGRLTSNRRNSQYRIQPIEVMYYIVNHMSNSYE